MQSYAQPIIPPDLRKKPRRPVNSDVRRLDRHTYPQPLMNTFVDYFQLGANGIALAVAGWIYAAYVKNIRSELSIKDEQIKAVEKNLTLWKDKASQFEKKTPEYMEEVLSKRIKHREDEIKRLNEDKEEHTKLISLRSREVTRLRAELEKTVYIGRALTYFDPESEEELPIPESEIEVEELGEIFVDSASILITDPLYIQQEWDHDEVYTDLRLYRHVTTGKVYQYGVHFNNYETKIAELQETPNSLIAQGILQSVEIQREFTYSYPGAAYASMSKAGYAELKFSAGHNGAGICVRTVHGDGGFTVYGERFRGDLVRIFIDLR